MFGRGQLAVTFSLLFNFSALDLPQGMVQTQVQDNIVLSVKRGKMIMSS